MAPDPLCYHQRNAGTTCTYYYAPLLLEQLTGWADDELDSDCLYSGLSRNFAQPRRFVLEYE